MSLEEDQASIIERLLSASCPAAALGLEMPVDAVDVRKRFRDLSKLVHPDKCTDERATAAFQALQRHFEARWRVRTPVLFPVPDQ